MIATNQELAAYAEKTAEIVEQGWCQYSLTDGKGNYCARGAAAIAVYGDCHNLNRTVDVLISKAAEVIKKSGFISVCVGDHSVVTDYNDGDRTQSDIVDLFKQVAKEFSNSE